MSSSCSTSSSCSSSSSSCCSSSSSSSSKFAPPSGYFFHPANEFESGGRILTRSANHLTEPPAASPVCDESFNVVPLILELLGEHKHNAAFVTQICFDVVDTLLAHNSSLALIHNFSVLLEGVLPDILGRGPHELELRLRALRVLSKLLRDSNNLSYLSKEDGKSCLMEHIHKLWRVEPGTAPNPSLLVSLRLALVRCMAVIASHGKAGTHTLICKQPGEEFPVLWGLASILEHEAAAISENAALVSPLQLCLIRESFDLLWALDSLTESAYQFSVRGIRHHLISLLTKFVKNSVHPSLAELGERATTLRERIDLWGSEAEEEPKQ